MKTQSKLLGGKVRKLAPAYLLAASASFALVYFLPDGSGGDGGDGGNQGEAGAPIATASPGFDPNANGPTEVAARFDEWLRESTSGQAAALRLIASGDQAAAAALDPNLRQLAIAYSVADAERLNMLPFFPGDGGKPSSRPAGALGAITRYLASKHDGALWNGLLELPADVGAEIFSGLILAEYPSSIEPTFIKQLSERYQHGKALREALLSEANGIAKVASWLANSDLRDPAMRLLEIPKIDRNAPGHATDVVTDLAYTLGLETTTPEDFFDEQTSPGAQDVIIRAWVDCYPIDLLLDMNWNWLLALDGNSIGVRASSNREVAADALLARLTRIDVAEAAAMHETLQRETGVVGNMHNAFRFLIYFDWHTAAKWIARSPKGEGRDNLVVGLLQDGRLTGEEKRRWANEIADEERRAVYLEHLK